jgi:hypothetical protein
MAITVHIDRWNVTKILVDNGSQAEILFLLAKPKSLLTMAAIKESSSKTQRSSSTASTEKELNQ